MPSECLQSSYLLAEVALEVMFPGTDSWPVISFKCFISVCLWSHSKILLAIMGRHSAVWQSPITVKMPFGKFRLIHINIISYYRSRKKSPSIPSCPLSSQKSAKVKSWIVTCFKKSQHAWIKCCWVYTSYIWNRGLGLNRFYSFNGAVFWGSSSLYF